nr:uncharacterized protein LOC118878222 isoform X2 [Drosophila suzukii]
MLHKDSLDQGVLVQHVCTNGEAEPTPAGNPVHTIDPGMQQRFNLGSQGGNVADGTSTTARQEASDSSPTESSATENSSPRSQIGNADSGRQGSE